MKKKEEGLKIQVASNKDIKKASTIFKKVKFSYSGCQIVEFSAKEVELALVAKENDEIVGYCYAEKKQADDRTRKTAYIGYFVMSNSQSKGIGTALTKRLLDLLKKKGFVRAECDIAKENIASWKLAEDLGFKREGVLKKRFLTDDSRFIDDYWYGKIL